MVKTESTTKGCSNIRNIQDNRIIVADFTVIRLTLKPPIHSLAVISVAKTELPLCYSQRGDGVVSSTYGYVVTNSDDFIEFKSCVTLRFVRFVYEAKLVGLLWRVEWERD
ncbi:hypothetical protein RHGRI_015851 [Rhododendron griersonianum]|uniref:Uncharacterized protein n=1 Tax=Rhododendron griersonianum TaxID=479676 RepID=A0AAV6JNT1_9ERIC|nr:hypothetical protein RHGRI_015851 [Rhododendron griersonianum]